MFETAYRTSLLLIYQFTVLLGILMMPLVLLARQVGVNLPVGRLVQAVDRVYADASETR